MKYTKYLPLIILNAIVFNILFCSIRGCQIKTEVIKLNDILTKKKKIEEISYFRDGCNYIMSNKAISAVGEFERADWIYRKFTNYNNNFKMGTTLSPSFPVKIRLRLLNPGFFQSFYYGDKSRNLRLFYDPETGVIASANIGSHESATVSPEFKAELQRVLDCLPKDKPCKPCKGDEPYDAKNPCEDYIDVSAPTPK
jgi:hypothetical protein